MRLDDRQIERYSRQIVLPEVGVEGQRRLLDARVAVTGEGVAAAEILAYLAAAGVGGLMAPRALHDAVDPAARTRVTAEPDPVAVDVAIVVGRDAAEHPPRAPHLLWIVAGRAGAIPPCARCAAEALPAVADVPDELLAVRDRLLASVVAMETVKLLVGTGTPLRGQVLTYDPLRARVAAVVASGRPACGACGAQTQS